MWKPIAALLVFLVTSSFPQTNHARTIAQAFSEWGDFLAGGVWTGRHEQGHEHEQSWEWVLDRAFLQVRWKVSGDSGMSLFGIEPSTGRLTWWGFDHDGRVWKGTTNLEKPSEWIDEGTGQGASGLNLWKAALTRLGADEARLQIQENIVDGKAFAPEIIILKRRK
ncbi:MAG: hypothetical protein HYZ40_13985 [Rhodospirillales bacterium]|nr:hypothetical protein [Rhodospirillales bacterium]